MIRALVLAVFLAAPALAEIPPSEPSGAQAVPPGAPPTEAAPPDAAPPDAAPADAPAAPAIDPSDLIGAPAGPPLAGEPLREQTHAVAKLLRCPTCQGLSVADSRAESALAMRAEVEALVAQGYDAEQVLLYFEASYGEFIRLEPKFEGVNVLVWAAPVLLLLVGVGWIGWSVNAPGRRARVAGRGGRTESPSSTTGRDEPPPAEASDVTEPAAGPSDPALTAYLRRVREESR